MTLQNYYFFTTFTIIAIMFVICHDKLHVIKQAEINSNEKEGFIFVQYLANVAAEPGTYYPVLL